MSNEPERMWSTDRDQQVKMQRLYLAAMQARKMPEGQKETYLYAAFLVISNSGAILPAHKAQLVFEVVAQEK